MRTATIQSMEDVRHVLANSSGALCLYSGGLDGSWLLGQLAEFKDRITALYIDLGGEAINPAARSICQRLNIRLETVDGRERFANNFVSPAIMAQARYLGGHPISASLSRPLMAEIASEIAIAKGYDTIIHTADRSQNSLRRFNGALGRLNFKGHYGSPFSLSQITREEKRRYLEGHGLFGFADRINSADSNLWGREYEAGDLDNPEQICLRSNLFEDPESIPAFNLQIEFKAGKPIALNEEVLSLSALLEHLAPQVAGTRIGRFIWLEELEGGEKVQEVHDMPAATLLLDAYRRLESAVIPAESIREKMNVEQLWVREAVEGRWHGHLRTAVQAFISSIAEHVTGTISYRISPGEMQVTGLCAVSPLYVTSRDQILTENSPTPL